MSLSEEEKTVFIETAKILRDSERRIFMARVVKMLGQGGQRRAERELGWNRGTIRKGMTELSSGRSFRNRHAKRGRKRVEERLPTLIHDMKCILNASRQQNVGVFQSSTTRPGSISPAAMRKYLVEHMGYKDEELPTVETIRKKMKDLTNNRKR